jgi:hypothetical protein
MNEPVYECDFCEKPAEFKICLSTLPIYKVVEEDLVCRDCAREMGFLEHDN